MNRRCSVRLIAAVLIGLVVPGGSASAQQSSEIEAVKAANQAFVDALSSQDMKAMEAVWAKKPYVVNIGPRSKEIAIGFEDAVLDYWPRAFDRWAEINVTVASIAQVHVEGNFASVVGTERAVLTPKDGGALREADLFVTNLFERDGDRWLMISHHAQFIPK